MKYWIVVRFTGFDASQRQGKVKIWLDYSNSGHVYNSPAYEVIGRYETFKTAQGVARHVKDNWQLPSEVPASNKTKIVADLKKEREKI